MNTVDEVEVWVTQDGLGRAAVARRPDGLFCIYVHWKFAPEVIAVSNLRVPRGYATNWLDDHTPIAKLYEDIDPEAEIYGALEDARRAVRSLPGFTEASLKA